eukprot:jgi/Galph1/1364/GphlegSOOS_G6101.1
MQGRNFFIGGNWKCNGTKQSIRDLVRLLNNVSIEESNKVQVICAPPFPYLDLTRSLLRKDFSVAAQDCWVNGYGAFTGEVCPGMLKDLGIEWVILGHSERRHLPEIRETDQVVGQKTKSALTAGLRVILCIGEQLSEREAGKTFEVCERQLQAVAKEIEDWSSVVIAYEPVWAIGTGKVATPQQAQEVHETVRQWFVQNVSPQVAETIQIIYGGSVTGQNCDDLAAQRDVDGFLVGGASLKPEFADIIASHRLSLQKA